MKTRQYRPGHFPPPEVVVHQIVVKGITARIGIVQEKKDGWIGYFYEDEPGVTHLGKTRNPVRENQEEAVIDVLTDFFFRHPAIPPGY